ncbi:universal stress protein [Mycolicibacterium diernhoferi]|uniref:Universal stress protein n=1 Tax=Mycolicibacterium diernhoferi TaxID=1801 RepID=A0A1Q4HK60_9MYCO|nr:universal stress protein [Mycolicibacterium diernhoferi]OJZ67781.1 universal stress protein [Mycolicibacterium diernhoferi]OPE54445.1 universal stress protein [Mycolicibacterium diernhoferi]PEG51868.1 universal stress protein [Mycolicibacterium diernhoferi]QYL20429.1 universal stress protein [Mycolicibacterium diernhoferi]
MTILVGFSASGQGPAPLHLAAQLARCTGARIVAAAIVERPWPARPDPAENDYLQFLSDQTNGVLNRLAAEYLGELDVWRVVHQARSIPEGLTELAAEVHADLVVVGSSSAGLLGRIALGSVTDRLVHTAALPVAIAPRGYPAQAGQIRRLTVAYGGQADAVGLIATSAQLAQRWGTRLRIASFTVRPMTMYSGAIEPAAEDLVIKQWADRTKAGIAAQLQKIRSVAAEVVVGSGPTWRDAVDGIEWGPGDILVLGSGAAGPAAQVFLGSAAARILRHAPVPTMIVPRSRDAGSS